MRMGRRDTLKAFGALGLSGLFGSRAFAQSSAAVGSPPSVMTTPPRQWGPDAPPAKYPDEDIIIIDPKVHDLGGFQVRRALPHIGGWWTLRSALIPRPGLHGGPIRHRCSSQRSVMRNQCASRHTTGGTDSAMPEIERFCTSNAAQSSRWVTPRQPLGVVCKAKP